MLCFKGIMGRNRYSTTKLLLIYPSISLIVFYIIIATYRFVAYRIGGTDAISYISWFEESLNPNYSEEGRDRSTDFAFLFLMKAIRYFTRDYHVFFAIAYGIIVSSFVLFVGKFSRKEYCSIPFFMIFYLYLRSFNTLRSVLAGSLILIGLYLLADNKIKKSYIFFLLSIFTHKATLVFALAIPFCHLYGTKSIQRKYFLFGFVGVFLAAGFIRAWFISYFEDIDLGGAYQAYAREERSLLSSSTEFFGQYLLGAIVFYYYPKIIKYINSLKNQLEQRFITILLAICVYDVVLAPFNTFMGIWRGYEFFYVARMCMWSMLIYMFTRNMKKGSQLVIKSFSLFCFIGWFIFRLSRTYEASSLMPYVFEPLFNLL